MRRQYLSSPAPVSSQPTTYFASHHIHRFRLEKDKKYNHRSSPIPHLIFYPHIAISARKLRNFIVVILRKGDKRSHGIIIVVSRAKPCKTNERSTEATRIGMDHFENMEEEIYVESGGNRGNLPWPQVWRRTAGSREAHLVFHRE